MKKRVILVGLLTSVGLLTGCHPNKDSDNIHSDSGTENTAQPDTTPVTAGKKGDQLTIALDPNGGQVEQSSVTIGYQEAYSLPKAAHSSEDKGSLHFTFDFVGWYLGEEAVPLQGHSWEITNKAATLKAKWRITSKGNIGSYPQSVVSDQTTVDALNKLTAAENHPVSYQNNRYVMKKAQPQNDGYSFSDQTGIEEGKNYWFKYEPLSFHLYGESMDSLITVSDNVIDASGYFGKTLDDTLTDRNVDGKKIAPNNYAYSALRAKLNGLNGTAYGVDDYSAFGFGKDVFSEEEGKNIPEITVDNSAITTGEEKNDYVSENTLDRFFAMSRKENADNFGDDKGRRAKATDYALACGAFRNAKGYSSYWLRSPEDSRLYVQQVLADGSYFRQGLTTQVAGIRLSFRFSVQ